MHEPLVTVRQKETGAIVKINLCDLDESVEPVVPDVRLLVTPSTKRHLDREVWKACKLSFIY
jgi:hypothetical protein